MASDAARASERLRPSLGLSGVRVFPDPCLRDGETVVLVSSGDYERLRKSLEPRCTVEAQEPVVVRDNPEGFGKRPYWRGKPAYFYWCPDCGFTVQIGVNGACGECIRHEGCKTLANLYSVVDVVVDFMVAVGK